MNKNFNNVRVAYVQSHILGLPATEKAAEIYKIRTDFVGWMHVWFELTEKQGEELASLPEAFRNSLANQIADSWENDVLISFDKGASSSQEPTVKDVILGLTSVQQYRMGSTEPTEIEQLTIRITYQ
ncbi:hypothetical protein FAZ15_22080 [Sphingobacterium olei]|uniref:Uncharacterized protein n=1 Tax=Sphingobacterium olei TaxID=2571155 RepID=A0A4U0N7U6_9SPHI|nr:hypothetical protein [Sphingobacterium olei]TJZ49911.1 hypothetical protein FAZ15_22080 [Sphingobacterium olei]